ncbi:peptidoglycan-binding domain-containing protein [Hamadaea tsunoensis]|uniref:peptidoglycan-binding domain-containing protein n=1 Tax=Hamadaea tsunoensis TaxID=53368 RepID=UPI00040F2F51|nr:peptidoglycan-binding domain-containing protein [Hamadaea tsunoensis]
MPDDHITAHRPGPVLRPAAPTADTVPAHARPSLPLRWRLIAAIAVVLLGLAGTAIAPAHAAGNPQCTTVHEWNLLDANGDPRLGSGSSEYAIWTPAARYSDGSYRWSCLLSRGAHNVAVLTLQQTINACYGAQPQSGGVNLGLHLAEDADFGPATRAALIRVQQYHRITADGIYGPTTATTIRHQGYGYGGGFGTGPLCHPFGG